MNFLILFFVVVLLQNKFIFLSLKHMSNFKDDIIKTYKELVFDGKAGFSVLISETSANRPVCMGAVYDEWHVLTVARCCWKFHTKEYGKGILIFGGNDWIDEDTKTTRRNVESVHMPDEYIKGLKNYESLDLYSKHDVCLMKTDRQILLYEEDTKPKNLTENDPRRIWPIRLAFNPTPESYLHPSTTVCSMLGYYPTFMGFKLWRQFTWFSSNSFKDPEFNSFLTLKTYQNDRLFNLLGMIGGFLVCPDNVTEIDWKNPNYNVGYYIMGSTINITTNPKEDARDFTIITPIQYFREWLSKTAKHEDHEDKDISTKQSTTTAHETEAVTTNGTHSVTDEVTTQVQSSENTIIIILVIVALVGCVCVVVSCVMLRRWKSSKDKMQPIPGGELTETNETTPISAGQTMTTPTSMKEQGKYQQPIDMKLQKVPSKEPK